MADDKKKAQYAPPASQVDLEARLESGNASDRILSTSDSYNQEEDEGGREYTVEGNDVSEYVGVSPEYATYANETEAPISASEGPEAEVFKNFAAALEPSDGSDEDDEEEEETSTTTSSTSSSKPASTTTKTASS